MIKKRSKFWTVVFAMLPGAGHMFNGFMKKGVSIMGLFFMMWFIASWLNLGALTLLTPVVWFYAFFDCINLRFQEDEDFYSQYDDYVFDISAVKQLNLENPRLKSVIGIGLIIVGVYALWNNVILHFLWNYDLFPHVVVRVISEISYVIPQLIVGVLIILIGVTLVKGKKKEVLDWRKKVDLYMGHSDGHGDDHGDNRYESYRSDCQDDCKKDSFAEDSGEAVRDL